MITPMRKPISTTTGHVGTRLVGDFQHIAPVDATASRQRLTQLHPTLADEVRHLAQIRDVLHRGAAHMLEHARLRAAANWGAEILRVESLK